MSTTADARPDLVELSGINKRYPGVAALTDVSLSVRRGEVHGLIGENGAGKSTLIKVLSGTETPQSGTYRFDGETVTVSSPRQAAGLGISVLHQERHLVPTFSIAENVMLDEILASGTRWFDRKRIEDRARPYLEMLGVDFDPAAPVTGLSSAQAQLVEIARALSRESKLLILDEPTASIAVSEAQALLELIRTLRSDGVSVLYVSHKFEEVFAICDRVTVLRDGRNVLNGARTADLGWNELVGHMIGREHVESEIPVRTVDRTVTPALSVTDLVGRGSAVPATFEVAPGEILGWYGLVGAGRTELARVLVGAEKATGGEVRLEGTPAAITSVASALHRHGLGYVSEDRQGEGLFLLHSIARNVSSATWKRIPRKLGVFFDPRAEWARAERYREALSIKAASLGQAVGQLSGGNKQKVSLAKWLVAAPRVLVIDEPTVGIDINTKYEIHDLVVRLADEGMAIILISSDLQEMVRLADRICVFREGRIIDELMNEKDYGSVSDRVMSAILTLDAAGAPADDPAPAVPRG